MKVKIQQNEIITALKQYISSQGINLQGKAVAIDFTAGRKEGGLTADISIEELDIPDFFEVPEHQAPALTVVPASSLTPAPAQEAPQESPAPAYEMTAEAEVVSAPVKTTSLFGN